MNTRWHPWLTALLLASIASIASAEDGISDHAILIRQTVGLTGQIAGAVKEMNEGAHAYIATVNRSGGVFGRKIEIRTLDDKFDAALAAANAEVLIKRDHVFALFQNRGTPHTEDPADPGRARCAADCAQHRRGGIPCAGKPFRVQRPRQIPG